MTDPEIPTPERVTIVECPTCGAAEGKLCTRVGERSDREVRSAHRKRIRLAAEQDGGGDE